MYNRSWHITSAGLWNNSHFEPVDNFTAYFSLWRIQCVRGFLNTRTSPHVVQPRQILNPITQITTERDPRPLQALDEIMIHDRMCKCLPAFDKYIHRSRVPGVHPQTKSMSPCPFLPSASCMSKQPSHARFTHSLAHRFGYL